MICEDILAFAAFFNNGRSCAIDDLKTVGDHYEDIAGCIGTFGVFKDGRAW